jgi:quercetin dioxygenase-like cupin family protein
MAMQHAQSGEVIDVRPLGSELPDTKTRALIKSESFELIRLVLPAGKKIPEHRAKGEIVVHCLEGQVLFGTSGSTVEVHFASSVGEPRKSHKLSAGRIHQVQ